MSTLLKSYLVIIVILGFSDVNAQVLEWAKSAGGSGFDQGRDITVDKWGNVYTIGEFENTVDFDPGPGTHNLTSNGSSNVFILKMDASGNFLWVKSFGDNSPSLGWCITTDDSGYVYAGGKFRGTVDFDPGPGIDIHTSVAMNGNYGDAYVLKLDPTGNFIWVITFGADSPDDVYSLEIDDSGNVYAGGKFGETVDFDPGLGTHFVSVISTVWDSFLLKLDANGNFIWVKTFGTPIFSTSSNQAIQSIKSDGIGNVYLTGVFHHNVDFDPGPGIFNLTAIGLSDVFVLKLDTNGSFVWAKSFGGPSNDRVNSLELDDQNNIYTTGTFGNNVDFDPSLNFFGLTASSYADIFVHKFDVNGNFVWVKSIEGVEPHMAVNDSGNVYIFGTFFDTIDFDPGVGTFYLDPTPVGSLFIQRMDSNGDFIWAKGFGGDSVERSFEIYLDNIDNIYITGYFTDTVNFNLGSGTDNLISTPGSRDAFVSKMRICANINTDQQETCSSYTWTDGITYTASNTTATDTFTNAQGCDSIMVLNLTINYPDTTIDTVSACDNYTWIDGNTYYANNDSAFHILTNTQGCDSVIILNLSIKSNTFTDVQSACLSYTWIDGNTYTNSNNSATFTLTNAAGCDSVVTLDLTILPFTTGVDTITACDSYTWIDGNTYTASNQTASQVLTNSNGCDSIVLLKLTIKHRSYGADIQSTCESFTWIDGNTYTASNQTATFLQTNAAGCDSIITLDLKVNANAGTDFQTACDSLTWIDGNTYTASTNIPTHTLTNSYGCDSLVTLNLTINSVTDVSTTLNGNVVTANNLNQTYQWLACDDGFRAMVGETAQTFTANANGNYAVQINENGCIDTSNCVTVTTLGLGNVMIMPNPTRNSSVLTLEYPVSNVDLILTDALGRLLSIRNFVTLESTTIELPLASGVYMLIIKTPDTQKTFRLVKI